MMARVFPPMSLEKIVEKVKRPEQIVLKAVKENGISMTCKGYIAHVDFVALITTMSVGLKRAFLNSENI